jgi:Na+/proline symporter
VPGRLPSRGGADAGSDHRLWVNLASQGRPKTPLSFGYWCTDFLVIQRAMAAKSMNAAQRTPLVASVPKMLFPFLVILPGMVILALVGDAGLADATGKVDYNRALPVLLQTLYPSGLLGLGLAALLASFMSGMAGNVTAFNTVCSTVDTQVMAGELPGSMPRSRSPKFQNRP